MPEKIQQVPATLLDTLGIKSLGRNPDQLGDQVAGVIDLTEFYLARRIEVVRVQTTTATASGDQITLTIDNGEIWMVKELGIKVKNPTAAGDIMYGRLGWAINAATLPGAEVPLIDTVRHVATTGDLNEGPSAGVRFNEPRFFLPDTDFAGTLAEDVGGVNTVRIELTAAFYRLTV